MLSLRFNQAGYPDSETRYVFNPEAWFDNCFGEEYIEGDMERKMIKDIDKADVFSKNVVIHPLMGGISPFDLSGTVKTLIMVKNDPEHIFNGSFMGDLAVPWLIEIGKQCDRTVRFGYIPKFRVPYTHDPFDIRIDNDGSIVHTWYELLDKASAFIHIDER